MEPSFNFFHFRYIINEVHPFSNVCISYKRLFDEAFGNESDAFDLTEDLNIVPCDDISAEIHLVMKLLVEHWQDLSRELFDFLLDLFTCRLRIKSETQSQEHLANARSYWTYSLIKGREELLQLWVIRGHVHFVLVKSSLVPICNMHHLSQS